MQEHVLYAKIVGRRRGKKERTGRGKRRRRRMKRKTIRKEEARQ